VHVPPGGVFTPLQVFAANAKSAASLNAIEVNASAPAPLFVIVTVCAELDVPASCPPKLILVGEMEIDGCVALPLSATVCGLPAALSEMLTLADRDVTAPAVGVNITFTVHVAPPRKLGGQLFDCAKLFAFRPDTLMLFTASEADPVFNSVIACTGLAIPTLCAPKFKLAGDT